VTRFIGIAEETTYGTPVASVEYVDVVSESIVGEQSFLDLDTAGSRWIRARYPGAWVQSGSIDLIPNASRISKFLKWALGNVTTTGDATTPTAYKHEITPASTLPSFTLEIFPDVGSYSRQITGCGITSLRFEAPAREFVTATVDIIGRKEKLISPTTPSFVSRRPFIFYDGSVSGLVSANVEAIRLTIENDIADDAFVIDDRFLPGLRVQGMTVTGELDIAFLNWDIYRKFLGSATALEPGATADSYSLTVTFTSTEQTGSAVAGYEYYQMKFELPEIYLDTSTANFDRRDRIVQGVSFTAAYNDTAGYIIKATVINEKSAP